MTIRTEQQYQASYDALTVAVWEGWTKNGLRMDPDDREQAVKAVQDALTNTWTEGMTEVEWQAAALARLGVDPDPR